MNRGILQGLLVLAVIVTAACSGNAMAPAYVPQSQTLAQQSAAQPPDVLLGPASGDIPFLTMNPVRRLCAPATSPDRMECLAMMRTDVTPGLQTSSGMSPGMSPEASGGAETCPFRRGYCPIDLQRAYELPSLSRGTGQVVAIVDAYGYHHAESDLAYFRRTMGLKACTTATKCLRILNQYGKTSPLPQEPPPSDDWRGEDSLDLDMVSGICPNCKIVYIQAQDHYTSSLYTGVQTAGRTGAKYIGVSWGSGPEGGNNSIFHQPGHVISAAAGDNGGGGAYGGPIQPCTYTYVVCVGGTHLVRSNDPRGWHETVWNDFNYTACGGPCGATGSACSTKIAKPSWQTDEGCKMRSAADVSATASLRAPVIVYNTEIQKSCPPSQCFFLFGGTSASTQIISAVFALGGNAGAGTGASWVYKHRNSSNLHDVWQGNNIDPGLGVNCASKVSYICTARYGFDGPTGWGTPHGIGAF